MLTDEILKLYSKSRESKQIQNNNDQIKTQPGASENSTQIPSTQKYAVLE